MRISELARETGIPVATVKYYLREGLVPPGEATSATQAQYDERHTARLRLARALVHVGGLSIDRAREVLNALDTPDLSLHEVLRVAHSSLPPQLPGEEAAPRAASLIAELRWQVHPDSPALRQLEQALVALESVDSPASTAALVKYAQVARGLAEGEVASVPRDSRDTAATAMIIGTVLWEPILLALRRLAQEAVSAEELAGP
ncbi:MerR family transcriptional regulator [Nocardioides sp.]|uniref:MerR family transcriptional regulator n=1 Tax=Nocardioides sp. TaxID=35761 RepID=UPI002ED8F59A